MMLATHLKTLAAAALLATGALSGNAQAAHGSVDVFYDRCRNPDWPHCGIRPRYRIEGWACESAAAGGSFISSRLIVTEHWHSGETTPYPWPTIYVTKQNFRVVSRPDVVAAGLCSTSAVGFSFDIDGETYNRDYKITYSGVWLPAYYSP